MNSVKPGYVETPLIKASSSHSLERMSKLSHQVIIIGLHRDHSQHDVNSQHFAQPQKDQAHPFASQLQHNVEQKFQENLRPV